MFICIFVPDFPLQAILRCELLRFGVNDRPVALLDGALLRVFACNDSARRAGIERGMTKIQAEAAQNVIFRKRSAFKEQSAQAALLDCAHSFSSQVEATNSGTVIFCISGTERLFGPPATLAIKVLRSADKLGFQANVAVAGNPDTACYAARGFSGVTVISAGEEAARLAPLSLRILSDQPAVRDKFKAMGIVSFSALAALPPIPLVQRFGQSGLQLQALARGATNRLLLPAKLNLRFIEVLEFDDPVENLEPLTFVFKRLLEQLLERLSARSLATNKLHVQLQLEVQEDRDIYNEEVKTTSNPVFERTIKLPIATQDAKVLLRLLQLDLSSHPPSAPVKKVVLEAGAAPPGFAQSGLFDRLAPQTEQLEVLLARLRGIVGENDAQGRKRVGTPVVSDSHAPDSFSLKEFTLASPEVPNPVSESLLALRRFRPPWPVAVKLGNEKPTKIKFRANSSTVFASSGPWRSSGNWWNTSRVWAREEWDVALQRSEGVELYRIFQDLSNQRWFVEGVYD